MALAAMSATNWKSTALRVTSIMALTSATQKNSSASQLALAVEVSTSLWIHPPYWRQKLYADDPRDLSRAPTLEAFLERYALALAHCAYVLKPGGILAVLMGDYSDRQAGFVPSPTTPSNSHSLVAFANTRPTSSDSVHGASSGKKVYRSRFIPGLHDVCALFTKPE